MGLTLVVATMGVVVLSPQAGAGSPQRGSATGECFAGGTPVMATVTGHVRHHGDVYKGTTTLTLPDGNSIHYHVKYTVVSAHTWTGTMVVESTEVSHTFYYIYGSAFFADNGSYASASGTEFDLC